MVVHEFGRRGTRDSFVLEAQSAYDDHCILSTDALTAVLVYDHYSPGAPEKRRRWLLKVLVSKAEVIGGTGSEGSAGWMSHSSGERSLRVCGNVKVTLVPQQQYDFWSIPGAIRVALRLLGYFVFSPCHRL